mmetsp:Transcript_105568/g.278804  ORF Transcript_105568/g.278804 Transcript_105568/m.278804 type:complete len:533 (+) Transcript_105568:587-2185(+)
MPFSISALLAAYRLLSSLRMASISACALASLASPACNAATSSLSWSEREMLWSILVDSFSISEAFSPCLALDSDSSLSQYALCEASAPAWSSSFSIMSVMRPLTFAKGSSPTSWLTRMAEAILCASCASPADFCSLASLRTKRTASKWARSAAVRRPEEATCRRDAWLKPYAMSFAPLVDSLRTFLASARALSSSARDLVSSSKSCALDRQFWWRSSFVAMSVSSSLDVTARSPSAVAFACPLAAMPFLASSRSLLPNLMESSSDCFSISKLWVSAVSVFRAPSSCSWALSKRLWSTSTIPPLWPSYTAASGAPASSRLSESSSPCVACAKLASLLASAELKTEACTIAEIACTTLLTPLGSCSIAAPCFDRRLTARSSVPMMSTSSFSSASKSAFSFDLISTAALRSASSVARLAASSSTFVLSDAVVAASSSIFALSSWTSALPVVISKPRFLERSSHHSENSAKTLWDSSPSAIIFFSRSESISSTLPIGFTCSAEALARVIEEATQRIAATAIFIAPSLWRGGSYSCC